MIKSKHDDFSVTIWCLCKPNIAAAHWLTARILLSDWLELLSITIKARPFKQEYFRVTGELKEVADN